MNTSTKSVSAKQRPEAEVFQRVRDLVSAAHEFTDDLNSMHWAYEELFMYKYTSREPVEKLATLPITMLRLMASRMAQIDEMGQELMPGAFAHRGSVDAWLAEFGDTVVPENRR